MGGPAVSSQKTGAKLGYAVSLAASQAASLSQSAAPVSSKQRVAAQASLATRSMLFNTLSKLPGARPDYATSVIPLRDPALAYQERLALVAGAERSVIATSYMVTADDYGIGFVDALISAAKSGKKVVLGLDWLAQTAVQKFASDFDNKRLFYKLRELRFYGGTVAWFAKPLTQLGHPGAGMHLKTLLVDGNTALVGGRNVGHHYYEQWADFEVKLTGAAASAIVEPTVDVLRRGDATCEVALTDAAAAQKRYNATLDELSWDARRQLRMAREKNAAMVGEGALHGALIHRFIADPVANRRRFNAPENAITTALVALIGEARHKIVLSSNYVNGGVIVEALLRARDRGVAIDVVTTGEDASELSLMPYANARATYERMAAAGIRVHESNKRMEHAKLYCFDDQIAAFGSYNVEPNADTNLVEGLWVTDDATIVSAVQEALSDDVTHHTDEMKQQTRSVTAGDYVLGWFLQAFL